MSLFECNAVQFYIWIFANAVILLRHTLEIILRFLKKFFRPQKADVFFLNSFLQLLDAANIPDISFDKEKNPCFVIDRNFRPKNTIVNVIKISLSS